MTEFSNNTIDLSDLPKYELVTFQKLHPKYWNVIVINLLILSIIILVAVVVAFISMFASADSDNVGAAFYVSILIVAVGFIVFLFWMNSISFKKRGYALREKDLLYRSGVLSTSTTIVPFIRIQHIAVSEGMFSRIYGLASLEIYTAGGSSSDLSISGISKDSAYSIKEFLMKNLTSESVFTEEVTTPNNQPDQEQSPEL